MEPRRPVPASVPVRYDADDVRDLLRENGGSDFWRGTSHLGRVGCEARHEVPSCFEYASFFVFAELDGRCELVALSLGPRNLKIGRRFEVFFDSGERVCSGAFDAHRHVILVSLGDDRFCHPRPEIGAGFEHRARVRLEPLPFRTAGLVLAALEDF